MKKAAGGYLTSVMPTKEQVLSRLEQGGGYEAVGRELGISAGKAYMIATGIPADGSDSLAPEDYQRPGLELGGTQALIGVPAHNPNGPDDKPQVMAWVHDRARADQQMQAAAAAQKES